MFDGLKPASGKHRPRRLRIVGPLIDLHTVPRCWAPLL
ncbi:MAG: hypothetical protein RL458_312 [Pseudomonadota bacterium]|jgi:hypothetical protein